MWIIFGNRVRSERVPNGKVAERRCGACGEVAMFYERRVVSTMQLYFLDVFNYKRQRAMSCGACGALYATDEFGAPEDEHESLQSGTIAGTLESAAKTVGDAVRTGASEWLGRGRDAVRSTRDRLEAREESAHNDHADDPLRDEDDELNRRFAELERKVREKKNQT
jgi:hypothetical protein